MKYLLPILVASMLLTSCYTVTPINNDSGNANGGGIFYALPFTQICVDVTYQYYDLSEAIFSRYASEMLALDNFDVERPYRIKDIQTSKGLKDAWHTLDGRRLNNEPTTKGLYIRNGKKILVR